jgi:hypothetical protein
MLVCSGEGFKMTKGYVPEVTRPMYISSTAVGSGTRPYDWSRSAYGYQMDEESCPSGQATSLHKK